MGLAKVLLQSIKFSDGTRVPIDKGDIVVIVGGNNVGKSSALREIYNYSSSKDVGQRRVIKDIEISCDGNGQALSEYLRSVYEETDETFISKDRHPIPKSIIDDSWNKKLSSIGMFPFCNLLSTEARLAAANKVESFDVSIKKPQNPIQRLFVDDHQEKRISDIFKQAFGFNLVLDKIGGTKIPLYVADDTVIPCKQERTSTDYANKLRAFPTIQSEGDGMRSFAGILLDALVGQRCITLIDEPEVFLHPPQARLLAKTLVLEMPVDKQLIIATHSQDIINGLLDEDHSGRVKIIRLCREDTVNKVSLLDSAAVKTLWADPLLRYSNILNGLFHEHVVLCEADTDCKFYQAILESLFENTGQKRPDILFTHCGGKDRMKNIIRALEAINVPVSVICDIDVLNKESAIKGIVEAKNTNWDTLKQYWKVVADGVAKKRPEIETSQLAKRLKEAIDNIQTPCLADEDIENLKKLIKKTSAWSEVKMSGVSALPAGNATVSFNALNEKLQNIGVFIVPVGELEGFDKTIGGHGVKWVMQVMEKGIAGESMKKATEFIKNICKKNNISV